MGLQATMELLKEIAGLTIKLVQKQHGLIHKRTAAEVYGKKGFLVWDYIVFNEITFDDMDGNMLSFFTSPSDEETERVWNELVNKYGVNNG